MSLNKPEFKVESDKNVVEDEKHSSKKDDDTVNSLSIFFYTLIFLALSGTVLMIVSFDKYWTSFIDKKPEGYKIPTLSDLWIVLYILPFIIAGKVIFEYSLGDLFYPLLEKKYLNPNDEENFRLGLVYKKKTATGLFKLAYFIFTSIIGYYILKDLKFMPKEIFIFDGDMNDIYSPGVPDYLFFPKHEYFDMYYLMGISYVLTDLIWLLFFYEAQTDFALMLLHHVLTISLILFSYLTNLSSVGVVVLYLHDFSDVFCYFCRTTLNLEIPKALRVIPAIMLFLNWIYVRLYVFGKCIYLLGNFSTSKHPSNIHLIVLWYFLVILFFMHAFWIAQIGRRLVSFKFLDIGKVKKSKEN